MKSSTRTSCTPEAPRRGSGRRLRAALGILGLVLLTLLAGCLPTTDARPGIAVFNAPRPVAMDDLATRLSDALEDPSAPYRMVNRSSLAFLETRSGLDDAFVYDNAAKVARNRGAVLAVLVSVPDPQRTIRTNADGDPYAVEASVYVETVTVFADDGRIADRRVGPVLTGRRDVSAGSVIPVDVRDDPLVVALAERGVDALASELDVRLSELASRF